MENIIYIIKTQNGKFKPFVGKVTFIEEDNDSTLYTIASGERCDELEDAVKFATDNAGGMKVYKNPVSSNMTGITWLSEVLNANPEMVK